jgi:hypothetical protein
MPVLPNWKNTILFFNKTLILKNNVFIITGEMEFYNPLFFIGTTKTHRK